MQRFILRRPDGTYLNTEYSRSIRNGNWSQHREEARLYKSKAGIKSALAGTLFPCLLRHIGRPDYRISWDRVWTDQDRTDFREVGTAVRAIPSSKWWELMLEDGFVLEVIEI